MSSTGLIRPNEEGVSVIDPDTGEVHALEVAPSGVIARVLGMIDEALASNIRSLREAKAELGDELIRRMDKTGEWTFTSKGVKVTAPSPSAGTESWDAELLDELLDHLVDEEVITREAKLRAVEQRTELVTNLVGVRALLKIPAVAERIAPARRVAQPAPRRVSVKPHR